MVVEGGRAANQAMSVSSREMGNFVRMRNIWEGLGEGGSNGVRAAGAAMARVSIIVPS